MATLNRSNIKLLKRINKLARKNNIIFDDTQINFLIFMLENSLKGYEDYFNFHTEGSLYYRQILCLKQWDKLNCYPKSFFLKKQVVQNELKSLLLLKLKEIKNGK